MLGRMPVRTWVFDGGRSPMPSDRRSDTGSTLLDDVNRRLVAVLHEDPRISMSALARRLGMSAPAVTERLQRLERAGVVRGYRVDVDPAALGLPVTAFARDRKSTRLNSSHMSISY